MIRHAALAILLLGATPIAAKDDLGVFDDWGAFRDPGAGRCYAIAVSRLSKLPSEYAAYASVGSWPRREVRGQLHFRLSRKLATNAAVTLAIGAQRFRLIGGGGDAWAADRAMDAAIVAAMRSSSSMAVSAIDVRGRRFTDRYSLAGAATALDAASLGCARVRR